MIILLMGGTVPYKVKTKTVRNRLDKLIREVTRLRDGFCCQKCGQRVDGSNAQPSHVLSKGAYKHLRWEVDNVKTLCCPCHIFWWHKEPMEAKDWFIGKFPERWERLQKMKNKTRQFKRWDLLDIEKKLKELKIEYGG